MAKKTLRKTGHTELMDGSNRPTKLTERENALEVLNKAKQANKNKPVKYLTAKDNEFRRELLKELEKPKKQCKITLLKKKIDKYNLRKSTIIGRAFESGMSRDECCELAGITINNFGRTYKMYQKDKDEYNELIKQYNGK